MKPLLGVLAALAFVGCGEGPQDAASHDAATATESIATTPRGGPPADSSGCWVAALTLPGQNVPLFGTVCCPIGWSAGVRACALSGGFRLPSPPRGR